MAPRNEKGTKGNCKHKQKANKPCIEYDVISIHCPTCMQYGGKILSCKGHWGWSCVTSKPLFPIISSLGKASGSGDACL